MSWRLGVVGHPVGHSLSPRLHRAGLAQAGLVGTSRAVDVADLAALAAVLPAFDALSVTMPLKALASRLCDELDEVATRTGRVNSLLRADGRVRGANTDGRGLLDALAAVGWEPAGRRATIFGAGGAAWSIVDALVGAGTEVAVATRQPAAAAALAERYPGVVSGAPGEAVDLVVNTVPVAHREDQPAVGAAGPGAVAVDITYEPRVSAWLAEQERRHWITMNGLPMLAHQGARQMAWWFSVPIDGAALVEVLA
ncbi:MAG: shikimate dehydrogenase family protein [Acidimicrobiales bacterium]